MVKKKVRKTPTSKKAKKRRGQATARVYAKKFREDPRAAFETLMNCLSQQGDVNQLKSSLRSQYQTLQSMLAEKQAAFIEKQATLLHPLRAFQSLFVRE